MTITKDSHLDHAPKARNMLTIDDVKELLSEIRKLAKDDYEAAHSAEDKLHALVLREIALGASDPARLAKEALKSSKIEFARHCA